MSNEALLKKLDKLSHDNRIFTDNLIRLMRKEITSMLPFDETWYYVQIPSYAGGSKVNDESVFQISAKSFAEIKTAKNFFTDKELNELTEWMKSKKAKIQVQIRFEFNDLFNESTTSCLN